MASSSVAKISPEPVVAVKRGFPNLPCPKCGEMGSVQLQLASLDCFCAECECEFDLEDVRSLITLWSAVLAWCDLAPAIEE